MFDAKRLIDQFLGAGGGNLQQTLSGVLGQLGQAGGQGQGRPQGDPAARGRDFLSGNTGSLATGALAGGLLTMVLGSKSMRGIGGDLLKYGGLAAIGGLAWKAYSDYQAGKPPLGLGGAAGAAPSGGPTPLLAPPSTPAFTSDATAQLVLRAMIAAAKADGHVDDKERARLTGEMGQAIGDEASAFIDAELANPASIEGLAAQATTPELATQVYAASLVAIDPDTDVERSYLATLAARLGIDPALKAHLETTVAQAKASA
jgi:uncharacterized membrane protein YebE (DUF533 family)